MNLKKEFHHLNLSYIVLNYLYSGASHHSSKISEAAKKGQKRNQNQTDRKKNSAENSLKDKRYRRCAIISRGLYIFYLIFHCGL